MPFQMGSCSLDRVSEFLIFNSLLISSLYIIYRGYKFLYLFPTSNKQFLYPTYILISGENHAWRRKRKGSPRIVDDHVFRLPYDLRQPIEIIWRIHLYTWCVESWNLKPPTVFWRTLLVVKEKHAAAAYAYCYSNQSFNVLFVDVGRGENG